MAVESKPLFHPEVIRQHLRHFTLPAVRGGFPAPAETLGGSHRLRAGGQAEGNRPAAGFPHRYLRQPARLHPARRIAATATPCRGKPTSWWTASRRMPCSAASGRTSRNIIVALEGQGHPRSAGNPLRRAENVRRGPMLPLRHQSPVRLDHRHLHAGNAALSQGLEPADLRALRHRPAGQRCRIAQALRLPARCRPRRPGIRRLPFQGTARANPKPSAANSPTSSTAFYAHLRQTVFARLRAENSAVPPQEILRCSQKLLDRILFCAFCEDRGLLPAETVARCLRPQRSLQPQAHLGQLPRPVPLRGQGQRRPENPRLQRRPLRPR